LSNQQPYGGPPPYQGPPQQWGAPQYPQQGYSAPQQYAGTPYAGPQFAGPQHGGPPPPGGPGFGWGPGGPQQPKKKSKVWLIVLPLGIIGVAVVGAYILGVINKQHQLNDYSEPEPSWTYTPTSDPSDDPTYFPSTEPTTAPTTTQPTAPQPTKTTPPPPRRPTNYEVVTRDAFYRTGAQPASGCRLPGSNASSIASETAFNRALKACLDRAWQRQVRVGRDVFRPPNVVTMNGGGQTPCGGSAGRSHYCDSNMTIYIDGRSDVQDFHNPRVNRMWVRVHMADTMAHEYGHHLQNLTGISDAFDELWYESPNKSAQLEINRRMEIQATCFSSVFQGANKGTLPVSRAYKDAWNFISHNSGDEWDTERTHGSKYIQPYWMNRGFNSRNVALCNTFTATSDKVR
jgi:predicted metalloprotease